ncbi:Uncharacterised protein [Mycobacteroides abscessus subsp. abscessus]|nr:Uncharacterised protein [Mycobacteroides abscessus subsp. abscessus]
MGERQPVADHLEHVGQSVTREEDPAEEDLREDEDRHELDDLEFGAGERAREQPECGPEQGVGDRDDEEEAERTVDRQSAHPHREGDGDRRLDDREEPEGECVAEDEVALAQRHRQQALEGAAAPLTQGADARDEEHDDEREEREHRRPDRLEHIGLVEDPRDEPDEQARHDEEEGDRAGIVADLGEHATRRGQRALRGHRRPPLGRAGRLSPRRRWP